MSSLESYPLTLHVNKSKNLIFIIFTSENLFHFNRLNLNLILFNKPFYFLYRNLMISLLFLIPYIFN